jgi:hypothetical protein
VRLRDPTRQLLFVTIVPSAVALVVAGGAGAVRRQLPNALVVVTGNDVFEATADGTKGLRLGIPDYVSVVSVSPNGTRLAFSAVTKKAEAIARPPLFFVDPEPGNRGFRTFFPRVRIRRG